MTYNMNLAFMGAGRIFAIQPKAKAISNAKYHITGFPAYAGRLSRSGRRLNAGRQIIGRRRVPAESDAPDLLAGPVPYTRCL